MKIIKTLTLGLIWLCLASYTVNLKAAGHHAHEDNSMIKSGAIKVTILYPNAEGASFDRAYYAEKHMPMIAELLGDSLTRYGIDQGLAGRAPGQPAPFVAIGYLYFDSLADFQTSFGPHAEVIRDDVPNYTNIKPVLQISEIIH